MKLEVNLVKVPFGGNVGSNTSKFINRTRYDVENDTDALNAIAKFIKDNVSEISLSLTDQRLVAQLQELQFLTITDLQCLRYLLALKGIDIWYFYVKEDESNLDSIPEGYYEYNVIDFDHTTGSFIQYAFKFSQLASEISFSKLYSTIVDAYGLFDSKMFAGIDNPLRRNIDLMKSDEDALGITSASKTAYVNSILEFLHKEIKVITN